MITPLQTFLQNLKIQVRNFLSVKRYVRSFFRERDKKKKQICPLPILPLESILCKFVTALLQLLKF